MKLTERQADALNKILKSCTDRSNPDAPYAYCECAPKREKPYDHRSLTALRDKGLIEISSVCRGATFVPLGSTEGLMSGGVYLCRPKERTVDPKPGTAAHTARLMAQAERHLPAGDRTDWDAWKEDMKEGGRT